MDRVAKVSLIKRYAMLCIGLFIMAFGVAFSIRGDLGTSPISSLPYVVSKICPLTVGEATIIMHCLFVLLQIIILRKKYQLIQLLQLVVAFVFGYLTDFAVWVTAGISCQSYWQQWLICVVGIILVGIGVAFEVAANVVTLAGEGLVLAVTKVLPVKFAAMKIAFDSTLVASAITLSVIFLHGLYGVREGTLAAAIFVGITADIVGIPLRTLRKRRQAHEAKRR